MANWNTLKTAIADVINSNGNQEITGQLLQDALNNIITNVGENATFAGIATLDTNPGAPDGPVFYLTATTGTYPNFNGIEVQDGEAVILLWNNKAWSKKVTGFATQEKLSKLDSKVNGIATKEELQAEVTRATNAELGLRKSINTEVTRATNAELELRKSINTEVTRAKEVEEELENSISANRYGYNVTVNGLKGGIHTIETAIKDVPSKFRMLGQKITFRTENGDWATYHNESLSLDNYENVNDWVQEVGISSIQGDVNITNAPDYEDLTEAANGTIKFADKEYSVESFSGLGRVYLRKNIVEGIRHIVSIQVTSAPLYDGTLSITLNGTVYNIELAAETHNTVSLVAEQIAKITDDRYDVALDGSTITFVAKVLGKGLSTNVNSASGVGLDVSEMNDDVQINQLVQNMFVKPNTIYIIQYDYDLQGAEITIPEGCVLDFQGGSFSNGKINLKLTSLISSPCRVFKDTELVGKLNVGSILLEWFGAKGDGVTDDTDAWLSARQYLNNNGGCLQLLNKTYALQPIDLVGLKNISIKGDSFAKSPWKTTTCIKIISEGAVGIRCTGDYQEEPVYDAEGNVTTKGGVPTEYATAVSLKDFYLNCNNMVQKGINCHYNVEIDSVEVRNSIKDGIVLEATTYPVRLRNVQTFSNGGDGLRVVAQNTTVYTIDGLESWGNGGYGLHIEGGNSCVIKNAILQSNKTGGLLMIQRNNSDFTQSQWLGSLLFENMYTEANGTLDESDEGYDGNYAVKIIGLTADRTFVNKIDSITFLNCKTLASATGKTSLIEGTSNIRLIGSLGFSIDYEKNIEYSLGTTRTGNLRIGDLNNTPLKRYHVQNNETYYLNMTTATGAIETINNSFHIQIVGTRINAVGCLDYTITGTPIDEFVKFEIRAFKYGMFRGNPKKMICGRGYISGKLSDGSTYRKEIILEAEPYSQLELYLRDAAGKNIYPTELPTSGTVNLTMFYPSTSSFN